MWLPLSSLALIRKLRLAFVPPCFLPVSSAGLSESVNIRPQLFQYARLIPIQVFR